MAGTGVGLGTIGYLVLIDHIGKCFKLKGAPRTEKHAFRAALRIFGSLWDHQLNEAKISALYALRCALAHDYTLYNIPDKPAKHPDLIHHFGVCGAGSPFVTFSNTTWDMNLKNNISHDQETWINLERVQDLAEGMYRKLRTLAKTNDLEVNLNEGPEALRKHYILRF